jgi:hypothetical protein
MFTALRSSHRPTPIARVTATLPALPHPHKKRHRHAGAAAIVSAIAVSAVVGLVAVLIGTAAVMSRDKLASIVSRGDRGEEQATDAAKE